MDFRKLSNDLLSFLYENNLLYDYFTQNGFNLLSSKIEGDLIRNIYTNNIIKFELNKEFELIELIIEDYKKNQDILEMRLDNEITNFDDKKMQHLIKDIKNNKYLAPYI